MNEISFGKIGNLGGKAGRTHKSQSYIFQAIKRQKEEKQAWKKLEQQVKTTKITKETSNKLDFIM